MSATTALPEGNVRPEQAMPPLRIVFVFMTLFARLRLFGSVIEGLLDRGHSVHVLIEDDSEHGRVEQDWLGGWRNGPASPGRCGGRCARTAGTGQLSACEGPPSSCGGTGPSST